jgi:hypothetical protein
VSDEERVHGGPHDPDRRLHAAFGAEVEALSIAPSPIGAVLRDGVALRRRRRAVWSGGVAGLLVLPVAAAVAFGGGTGGSRQDAAGRGKPTATGGSATATPTTVVTATAAGTATPARPTTASPTTPRASARSELGPEPPNPVDAIDVVGSGTFEGEPWRLVRDRFAARTGSVTAQPHFPFAAGGKNGLTRCEFLGIQMGDAPAGSTPDFDAGGACGPDLGTTPLGLDNSGSSGLFWPPSGVPAQVVTVSGGLDPTKVATFDILVDGVRKVDPTPVFQRAGDPMGYYAAVVSIPGVRSLDQHVIVAEFRNAQGEVVGQYSPRQPALPTK